MRKRLCALILLPLFLFLTGCGGLSGVISSTIAVPPPPEDYAGEADGFRYYRSCLMPQEQYVYDQMLEGLQAQEAEISDLYPDNDMVLKVASAIDRDYPELFWFSGSGEVKTTIFADTPLKAVYVPVYTMDASQRETVQESLDLWMQDCFAALPEDPSDYDKILTVHDYIIEHAEYAPVENNSILNIMVNGKGLCGCYAKTTQYLLNRLNVPCAYISGEALGEKHAWNLVWPDGVPCWLDTTWGDPLFSEENDVLAGGISHDYFCTTTEQLLRSHIIDDTVPVPDCVSEDYSWYRHNGLYFETYDPRALVTAVKNAVQSGEDRLCVQYADAAFYPATDALFTEGGVYDIYRQVDNALGTRLSAGSRIWYGQNPECCSVTLLFSS